MSDVPEQILDYASPMARTPLRMAVRSIIRMYSRADGVEVFETLTGQVQALTAIVFTSCTITLLGFALLGMERPQGFLDYFNPVLACYFVGLCGTAVLIVAVIHQNWRKTSLRMSAEDLTLSMETPFKSFVRKWPSTDVRFVHVMQSLNARTQRLVHDLQIEMSSGQRLQLFSGHEMPELAAIGVEIRRYIPEESDGLPQARGGKGAESGEED
jgi:hypothetical protein